MFAIDLHLAFTQLDPAIIKALLILIFGSRLAAPTNRTCRRKYSGHYEGAR